MNRSLVKSIILAVLMASPCWAATQPKAPHTSDVVTCENCHSSQATNGNAGPNAYNNVCLACHSMGGMTSKGNPTPFSRYDFANPFNTYTAAAAKGKGRPFQTSHKWSGSDNVPQAGALPLTGSYPPFAGGPGELLNKTSAYLDLRGTLSCSRCHDLHNTQGNTFASLTKDGHLLRADNTDDAMCMKCHVLRNTSDHQKGTHPVNINYAASTGVKPVPVSSNPSNYTATIKPSASGKVICSTCHRMHMADSNSSTFDNRTSARFNQLSTSQGHLLVASLRGPTADDINICTSCHASKMAHNGGGQGVQCADCHAGHVDLADGTTPNVFLVRRNMNYSTASGAVRNKVFYQDVVNPNYNGAGGVCIACHQVPKTGTSPGGVAYPPEHNSTGAVCKNCHNHSAAVGSFSGGCTTCHGYPPQTNTVGGPKGKASGYALDETTTQHVQHVAASYGCVDCHYAGQDATLHGTAGNGNFQNVFPPSYAGKGKYPGATPAYNNVGMTCSGVYCHSNGAPTMGSYVTVITPSWTSGTGVTCSSCHEASPTTNAHQVHLATTKIAGGLSCENCHNATVKNSTSIFNKALHANQVKDISFYSRTIDISGSNCATVACHTDGKSNPVPQVWTTTPTGNCGICHASTAISTNAHQAHLSTAPAYAYGPKLNNSAVPVSCNNCHSYPSGHLNGTIQMPNTCATLCHPNVVPLWSGPRITDCTSCHSSNPSFVNGKYAPDRTAYFATKGHGQVTTCIGCHNSASAHIGAGTKRLSDTSGTNSVCNSCHDTPSVGSQNQNMFTHVTYGTKELGPAVVNMKCYNCHDPHGTGNLSMIKSSIAYLNSTTSYKIDFTDRSSKWIDTTTNRGLCQVCHTKTAHYRAGVPETLLPLHPTTNCYTCHNHNDDSGIAFKPKGDCNSCHGYPPVPRNVAGLTFARMNNWSSAAFESYSGGGGAHTVAGHIPKGAQAKEGWANCAVCHNSGITGSTPNHVFNSPPVQAHITSVTIAVDPRYRFSDTRFVMYSGGRLATPPANKTGRCYNASCHFQKTPFWSSEKPGI